MSVDIVGSTAFKQTANFSSDEDNTAERPPSAAWFSPIAQFYRQIELLFAKEWKLFVDKAAQSKSQMTGPAPVFWKGIGDEVVYFKEVQHHEQAHCCIHCWIRVVNQYRSILQSKFPKLDLKATAWLAGFPVNNSEIIFRTQFDGTEEPRGGSDAVYDNIKLLEEYYSSTKSDLVRDFIGPSIDTGFRLGRFSSPRKMIISVELALFMASAEGSRSHFSDNPKLRFFFEGTASLKGVIGGIPYPIIWIDLLEDDHLEIAEDKISGRANVDPSDLQTYCEEFLSRHASSLTRPYIPGTIDAKFCTVPEKHQERLSALRNFVENERKRETELVQSDEIKNQGGKADLSEVDFDSAVDSLVQSMYGQKQPFTESKKLEISSGDY